MPAPFAVLEARVNAAVFNRLSNADATLDGNAVQGILDLAYQFVDVGGNGMASTGPVFELAASAVPTNVVGKAFVARGVSYTVVEPQPDGTGNVLLVLERA